MPHRLINADFLIVAHNTGAVATVSEEDFVFLLAFNWSQNPRGHFVRNDHGKVLMMHRVIAERAGIDLSQYIDHIDRNKLNNKRENLRPATNQQNQFNRSQQVNSTSPYRGVTWDKNNQRWVARIRYGDKARKHLGSFSTAEAAAESYNNAAKLLHGEYANLNNIQAGTCNVN